MNDLKSPSGFKGPDEFLHTRLDGAYQEAQLSATPISIPDDDQVKLPHFTKQHSEALGVTLELAVVTRLAWWKTFS